MDRFCVCCRHTYGEFHVNVPTVFTSSTCSVASDTTLHIHPAFTSLSLPHHRRHMQLKQSAPDVTAEAPAAAAASCEDGGVTTLTPVSDAAQGVTSAVDVDRKQRRAPTEETTSHIVIELHPGQRDHADSAPISDQDPVHVIRSSAPELHLFTSIAAQSQIAPQRRPFVVVAVADDVTRMTSQLGVHTAAIRRTGSCTLPTGNRSSPTTRRLVISLTNLNDAARSTREVVLPARCPSSSQPASSSTAISGCSPDRAPSMSLMPGCSIATAAGDWREVSKELWSLRAMLADHEDISIDESVDESTTATTTTPQSTDNVSVKSSADTVVGVDDRPVSNASADPPSTSTPISCDAGDTHLPPVGVVSEAPANHGNTANEGDDCVTRKPSIRRQNYREAIARRQNHRLQSEASGSNELSVPTSSVEAASDTESSLSLDRCMYAGSGASSVDTTASSLGDSTDSTAGGSDVPSGGHRLEQLRGDSGYKSLETQQSLGQARDFRRQSASHFLLDSTANVIYEDQMVTATSSDEQRAPASSSTVVVSVQHSTTAGVAIPVSIATADSTTSVTPSMRSGHRHNKAAQRKRIQYRCERQAVEVHDSVTIGEPAEQKLIHRHHHQHQNHDQPRQQAHRRSHDADSAQLHSAAQSTTTATTTTLTTTTTTKTSSLFSRLLRTSHAAAGSSAGGSSVAARRSSLVRMQRDYSIDERSNALFNEFLRHDPAYDSKHTLSVHSRGSRPPRRVRPTRASPSAGGHRLAVDELSASTTPTAAAETPIAESRRHRSPHTAPNTTTTSPVLSHKHIHDDAPRLPTVSLLGYSTLRVGRRRSDGSSGDRLTTDAAMRTAAASGDKPRRASTSADQSSSPDTRPSPCSEHTLAANEFNVDFAIRAAAADDGDVQRCTDEDGASQTHSSTAATEHACQRHSATTSRRIPVIQLTTDEDTLQ